MRAALSFLAKGIPGALFAVVFWYGWILLAWVVYGPTGGR